MQGSWQPAQISALYNCTPTHSPIFGEGTKGPQGLWLAETHTEMVRLDTVNTHWEVVGLGAQSG